MSFSLAPNISLVTMLHLAALLLALSLNIAAQDEKIADCTLEKNVVVQLHGWKYNDIRSECQSSESRYYCAFQILPPTEHQVIDLAFPTGATNPWWQRYNPVSYYLTNTTSGTLQELQVMITTCNSNNIRIYMEFEINNMGDRRIGYGSAGSYYNGIPDSISYAGVPYNEDDFHAKDSPPPDGCPTTSGVIEDIRDVTQMRYCSRRTTPRRSDTAYINDLRTHKADVRTEIVEAMDILLDYGVAGFRFAHARFVEPADASYFATNIKNVTYPGAPLFKRPFIYQDVIPDDIVSADEYTGWGRVEEVNAGLLLADILRKDPSTNYVMANLSDWGTEMGLMNSDDAIVYLDDPALQRGWLADWSEDGSMDVNQVLSYRDNKLYEIGTAFMLAHTYGHPRIHSSYDWNRTILGGQDVNEYQGPPRYENGTVEDVIVSTDGHNCINAWNCEHRWKAILGMVSFHNWAHAQADSQVVNFWSNGRDQIAFSRTANDGSIRGFVAFNNENEDLDAWIYSGLPEGTYCDLVTSDQVAGTCTTGKSVTVNSAGRARIILPAGDPNGVIAIFDLPI